MKNEKCNLEIPEIPDDETEDKARAERDRAYTEWVEDAKKHPDPTVLWDTNPENAYHCSICPHRNEGSWNTQRPCGCLKCWVTQTCHTWDGRDDI